MFCLIVSYKNRNLRINILLTYQHLFFGGTRPLVSSAKQKGELSVYRMTSVPAISSGGVPRGNRGCCCGCRASCCSDSPHGS